ncbi:hypothetical protein [Nocardia sp. NPDC057227]|uniref:hypothetical protein n=1 Tax=Nocardia sp. NPDC057227 TaxID=3346056 RepID=UPI003626D253
MSRKFAGKVVVDRRAGIVTVDGEEVPWELSADIGVTVELGDPKRTTVSTVVLGILCDDVEVIPADRGEAEKP